MKAYREKTNELAWEGKRRPKGRLTPRGQTYWGLPSPHPPAGAWVGHGDRGLSSKNLVLRILPPCKEFKGDINFLPDVHLLTVQL